jgi:predicted DCC family thiol-disulfide oxidoreductase YuxK
MVIAFDAVCVLCNGFVRFLLRRDHDGLIKFATNQSEAGAMIFAATGQQAGQPVSVVLMQDGQYFTESTAALHAIAALGGPWRLVSAFRIVPSPIRDSIYRLVARNRYRWFGKLEQCPLPQPEWADRFLP